MMIEINGKTRLCGLIGNPVEHTLSPLIHNFLAEEMGCNMTYVPLCVEQGRLEAAVRGAYGLNILGMNVTIPYKMEVIPYLSDVDELAGKMNSVNTLVRTEDGYKGYNTDVTGLMRAMKSDKFVIKDMDVIILGAGGVGRAVAFMCASNYAGSVYILNRNVQKAKAVADEVNRAIGTDTVHAFGLTDYADIPSWGKKRFQVIQCTSVGLYPDVDSSAIEDEEFYKSIGAGYDLIYNPWETAFIKKVKKEGAQAYNGLKMLLYQAVDAFELWNSCKVPDETAARAYEKLLRAVRE